MKKLRFSADPYQFSEKDGPGSCLDGPAAGTCFFAQTHVKLASIPNLLLVRSQQAEITIVKRLIQRRNNVTRVWVESRSGSSQKRLLYPLGHAVGSVIALPWKVFSSLKGWLKLGADATAGKWGGIFRTWLKSCRRSYDSIQLALYWCNA